MTSKFVCSLYISAYNFNFDNQRVLIFFFRFDDKEMVSGVNNAKSSVQKSIRNSVTENYPFIEPYLDQIIPKKGDLKLVKWYV